MSKKNSLQSPGRRTNKKHRDFKGAREDVRVFAQK